MAREGILHRTLRVERKKDRIRFSDWNVVNTSAGMCWEPRRLSDYSYEVAGETIDPNDCIQRIDRIDFDADGRDPYFRDSASNLPLMGGVSLLDRSRAFA